MQNTNTKTSTRYGRLAEIVRVVERFEDRSLPRTAWNHAAHLTVALWYMLHFDEARATAKMISGIRGYNHAHGIHQTPRGGYHETLTLFWLAITHRFVRNAPRDTSEVELFNRFLDVYESRPALFREYYTDDLLFSCRARQAWVEPDLKPLEGRVR